jgi:thiosulfate/3-mercaptopyruvate sulfurtransferase
VTTQWLQQNADAENLRIVDVRKDVIEYWIDHLPGAVYYHPDGMRLAQGGAPVMVMPPSAFVVMLGEMGISPATRVVVYTETGDYKAPYLVWALEYVGHQHVAVLEGGYNKWKLEGRPWTKAYPKITPTTYPLPKQPNESVRASLAEVRAALRTGAARLVDVRPPDLYTGERGFWKRNGHIPGAPGHYWADDLKADGTWKSKEDLRKAYEAIGVTPDQAIIAYCGQGTMSAHAWFTLKYLLGYPNVKNYDGGFSEWSDYDELPVKAGREP